MIRRFLAVALSLWQQSQAKLAFLPSSFQQRRYTAGRADIFVRWGGSGPVVVLSMGTQKIAIRGPLPQIS